jgi:hypothetical protein
MKTCNKRKEKRTRGKDPSLGTQTKPKKRANHQEEGEHIMFPILPHSQETSKGYCGIF